MGKKQVVVVGAGPAGSTAAFYINNANVIIIDQCSFPRHKACGGGLLNAADWPGIFQNFAAIESELHRHPIENVSVYWNRQPAFTRPGPVGWHVPRMELDNLLLQAALTKTNVTFRQFKVRSVATKNSQIVMSDGKEEIVADQVIGCDGWKSAIRRSLDNQPLNLQQYGTCIEYDIHCRPPEEFTLLFGWERELGYGWVFPTNSGCYVGVGFIGKGGHPAEHCLNQLVRFCEERGMIPTHRSIAQTFGAPDPVYVAKNYARQNILLAGDAMGIVKQVSGEGIYFAMLSGKIAGQTVDQDQNIAAVYTQRIQRFLREVTFRRNLPKKALGVPLMHAAFFLMRHAPGRMVLQNMFLNEIFRRNELPKGSKYFRF